MEQLNDIQLLDAIGALVEQQKQIDTEMEPLKAELLRRQKETGEALIENDKWESLLKRSPLSAAWLKREYGYELKDLPDGIVTEKIVPDLNQDRLLDWLGQDGAVHLPFTIQIKRKKAK